MSSKLKILLWASAIVYVGYTGWWLLLQSDNAPASLSGDSFSDTYGILALLGGIAGMVIAQRWGGFRSQMGRAVSFFSLGLLAQAFGQAVYSAYYFLLDQEVPYPSLGDIGYFGSVLLYIYAIYCLAKVSGVRLSRKSFSGKLFAILVPLGLLLFSYTVFLKDYQVDTSAPLTSLLDFGYPLGQAIYISLAILTFTLSRKILGGIMKGPILLVLFALVVQYVADFVFLYQASRETWEAGGISDFIYLTAYFMMTLALLSIGRAYRRIRAG